MNGKIKIILISALVLSLIVIPKVAFSSNGIYDSFNYSNTALAQTAINDGGLDFYPYDNAGNSINRHSNGWSGRWVVTSSIASLSLVTGLSPREMQSLPICAIGIIVMSFLVAMELTKDWRLAAFYTTMIAYDPTVNSLTNGTYIQGWGFIFYFMLIFLALIIVKKKHYLALMKKSEHYKPFLFYSSLAACSMAMMFFSYYSTLIYGVIMLAVLTGGIMFASSGKPLNRKRISVFLSFLAIAFIGLYLAEPTVRFAVGNFSGLLGTFFEYAGDVVMAGGSRFFVGLLSYLMLFIPICLLGCKWLRLLINTRKIPPMNPADLIVTAFLVTGFVNIVMYTGLGLVDFKYFIMFFTLSALYALKRLHAADFIWRIPSFKTLPMRQIFAITLTILFVLKFATYFAPILAVHTLEDRTGQNWLVDNCLTTGTDSISDLRLSGDIMLMHAEKGNSNFNSVIYSSNYLSNLAYGNKTQFNQVNGDISVLIMTEENMDGHFNIGNWETWTIQEDPVEIVGYRSNIQKIYFSTEMSVWYVNS